MIRKLLIKFFVCSSIFLIFSILVKGGVLDKYSIKKIIYQDHLEFSKFKNFYDRYLGGVFPLTGIDGTGVHQVFQEKLEYSDIKDYQDGAVLSVRNGYLVPVTDEGIIVYVGEKDGYGNVVMLENSQGVDIWYGNICNSNFKLYDQLKVGDYIGQSCDDKIYLVYSKQNKILDYRDYLS